MQGKLTMHIVDMKNLKEETNDEEHRRETKMQVWEHRLKGEEELESEKRREGWAENHRATEKDTWEQKEVP